MKKIRFIIAGTGAFSEYHARTIKLLNNAELIGFYSNSKERAEKISRKYNCRAYANYEEVLKSEAEVIVIVNKNKEHAKLALEAINAKKNVIIEKPFAINKKEMDLLIKAQKKNNVRAISFLEFRYSPVYKEVIRKINSLGKIKKVNIEVFQNKKMEGWKSKESEGGGLLLMHLIHQIDILCMLVKEKPIKISGFLRKKGEVEDSASIILSYKDFDANINSSCSCEYELPEKIEIIGEKRAITILDNRIMIENQKNDRFSRIIARIAGYLGLYFNKVKYFDSIKFIDVYREFLDSIENNTSALSSLDKVKDSLELIFRIKENLK